MISKKTLEYDWLKSVSEKNRKTDITLIEKVVRALILLEELSKSNASFVFKGGTALMLLLGTTKRLSIDIDIIVEDIAKFSIESIFENHLSKSGFYRYEKMERITVSKIQKAHYKFYFTPTHKTSQSEDYVLLDILFENANYSKTMNLDINSKFLIPEGSQMNVKIPTPENLLGDKLTAFAPNTTGVPYEKSGQSRAMEIIKQLYDISCLFDIVIDIDVVRSTFNKFSIIEANYRGLSITASDVLEDIYQTSLCISTRGIDGNCNFQLLSTGIKSIASYIFSESYHIEQAIIDSAKTAYLSMLIKSGKNKIEKYSGPEELKNWIIDLPLNTKLNKFKKSNPEAFYYWFKTYELIKDIGEEN